MPRRPTPLRYAMYGTAALVLLLYFSTSSSSKPHPASAWQRQLAKKARTPNTARPEAQDGLRDRVRDGVVPNAKRKKPFGNDVPLPPPPRPPPRQADRKEWIAVPDAGADDAEGRRLAKPVEGKLRQPAPAPEDIPRRKPPALPPQKAKARLPAVQKDEDEDAEEGLEEPVRRDEELDEGDLDELDAAQGNNRKFKGSINKLNSPDDPSRKLRKPGEAGQVGKEKDAKWGAGWGQRFKQKPEDGSEEEDTTEGGRKAVDKALGREEMVEPRPAAAAARKLAAGAAQGILAHPLVARLARSDFGRIASLPPPSPLDEDSFQAQPELGQARKKPNLNAPGQTSAKGNVNMTICALVPSEQRFLPEFLLYHRALGVERFALYDTSAAGAGGSEEIDHLADLIEEEGAGEMAPSAEDIKKRIGRTATGLDRTGKVFPERIAGLERWIEQGIVLMHWMKFKDTQHARNFHEEMINHCAKTYARDSAWIAAIDVDEFLVMSEELYKHNAPFRDEKDSEDAPWQYPLHALLERPQNSEAACMPIPQLRYRNVGVRTLPSNQLVLATHTKRDVVKQDPLPEKVLLHSAFT